MADLLLPRRAARLDRWSVLLIANVDDAPRDASSAASGGERRRAAASGGEGTKGTIGICTKFKIGGLMSIFAIAAAHWGSPIGKHKIIESSFLLQQPP